MHRCVDLYACMYICEIIHVRCMILNIGYLTPLQKLNAAYLRRLSHKRRFGTEQKVSWQSIKFNLFSPQKIIFWTELNYDSPNGKTLEQYDNKGREEGHGSFLPLQPLSVYPTSSSAVIRMGNVIVQYTLKLKGELPLN